MGSVRSSRASGDPAKALVLADYLKIIRVPGVEEAEEQGGGRRWIFLPLVQRPSC